MSGDQVKQILSEQNVTYEFMYIKSSFYMILYESTWKGYMAATTVSVKYDIVDHITYDFAPFKIMASAQSDLKMKLFNAVGVGSNEPIETTDGWIKSNPKRGVTISYKKASEMQIIYGK
ncbi:MAG: hypothetical protein PHV30_01560 [Candidatus Margulisbacteria bacterium]|nr:hypothetical protein [Candidatus Margulisiibacteriota bacterium]